MRTANVIALILALALAGGMAFASTSEPTIQVASSSTVPSTVYPGTLGYLQVTLTNTGSADAQSVTAHYTMSGVDNSLAAGDVSQGSSIQISIPFKISQDAAGTIQVVSATIYYSYDSSTTSGGISNSIVNKQTAISIPLEVQQQNPLLVSTVSSDKKAIAAGEEVTYQLQLSNTGGVVNDLAITLPSNSTFSLDGATQLQAGSIPSSSSEMVNLTLLSSSSTQVGVYNVPVIFTYDDALNQPTSETLNVGPLSVMDASSQYRLTLDPLSPAEVGSQTTFLLTLQNTGSKDVSAELNINSTSTFTPIGTQKIYFDSVGAGSSVSSNITIGISSGVAAGYYALPITLTTSAGQTVEFDAGIAVDATPDLTVSLDTGGTGTTVQIANTGNTQIRSVDVKAKEEGASAYTENFIGTMNIDDFATVTLESQSLASGIGTHNIDVETTFRDSSNYEHTVDSTIDTTGLASSNSTGGAYTARSGTNGSGRLGGGGLLGGGLFRVGGTPASGGGFGVIPAIAALIVAAGAGYYAYRRWYGKGKAHAPAAEEKGRKLR